MKTVLVPTDFSENAHNALKYAAELVNQTGGKIIIAHIIALPTMPIESNFSYPADWHLEDDYKQELSKLAENLKKEYNQRFEVEIICQYGFLFTDLNELVKAERVDLVVMGTKGAGDYITNLIGTNTYEYMQIAVCPVLAIPSAAFFNGIKNIVYASSFEAEEKKYLQQLFGIAEELKAPVSIVNIKSKHQLDIVADEQILTEIRKQFPLNSFCVAQRKENNVKAGIQEFAQEIEADMVAVAVQNRNFIEDLFHKSLTKQLLNQITIPLLALPAKPYRKPVYVIPAANQV